VRVLGCTARDRNGRARVGGWHNAAAEVEYLSGVTGVATTGEGLRERSRERVRVLDGNLALAPLG
jgi:hypothetical protein